MKVFWLNGGLHLEPESDVEAEAMLVLLHNLSYVAPNDEERPRVSGHTDLGGSVERGGDLDV